MVTDMGEASAASREAYDGSGEIALDFGLSTLFATSEGQLLCQGWLRELRRYDERITKIARGMQKRGLKPRQSQRYRDAVTAFMHADLNAARNIGERRALSIGSVFQGKAAVLAELVRQFGERRVYSTRFGGRGSTADPRSSNPYFKGEDRRGSDVVETQPSQDLVAA